MESDKRFTHVSKDPKYRRVPVSTRKVTVDNRFNAMFQDKRFNLKYSVDKRGKPVKVTSSEQLKNFYEIESEEDDEEEDEESSEESGSAKAEKVEEPQPSTSSAQKKTKAKSNGFAITELKSASDIDLEKVITIEVPEKVKAKLQDLTVDYARGEGLLFSDSSSSEEETSDDEVEDEVIHDWGELDKDAGETETATKRLAVCNMDWDRIRAVDLMVLLNSFAPPGSAVLNVTIYPSDFGLERMKEEEVLGPKELIEMKYDGDGDEAIVENGDDDVDEYHREKLRQYQLNRLKYYYAVAECDSAETAAKVYEECDGQEFESSAARLDLRYIPDDMTFDDREPKDVCKSMPDASQYEPRLFLTSALQQAVVHLTWDETDPSRMQTMHKLFQNKNGKPNGNVDDDAIKGLLATSSEDEDDEEAEQAADSEDDDESCIGESDRIAKYRNLLAGIAQTEEASKSRKDDVEMEISWGVGLKEKAQQLVKKKLDEKGAETTWEQQLAKRREKLKAKRQEKKQLKVAPPSSEDGDDSDIPSDIDMNDPYFKEEFEKEEFRGKKSKKDKKKEDQDASDKTEEGNAAELDLLLMDENDGKKHFSLKSILKEEEKTSKGKKNKNKNDAPVVATADTKDKDFKIQVEDPRFSALFTSHHFNLDPSDPNFKRTEAMETILQEKQKRRAEGRDKRDEPKEQPQSKTSKMDPELSRLMRSVKVKATMNKRQKSGRP